MFQKIIKIFLNPISPITLIPGIMLVLSLNSLAGMSFLRTSGQDIVDSSGTGILLRGYGLGGWLVPEGYMLHVPGYGSPSYIDSLVRDLIGDQNADNFWESYRYNYVRKSDIDRIAQWGFNSIRLPFHYKNFYDIGSHSFKPEGFALLDTLLDWCEQNNMYLILDMHCAPGGQNKDNISDSDGIEARLWTEPSVYQPVTISVWMEIARRYADDPRIAGYDFLNEPVLPQGFSNQILRDFYIQLTDSVRQIDTNHIIFIEGNWYATDFTLLTPPWDNNMVYSFHKYWNLTTIATIQYLLDIRSQYNIPLWMGESGENSNVWYFETRHLFDNNQVGWCWWAHKKFNTITSPLSARINPEYRTVLDYWAGNTARPSQTYALNALNQMANNLKLDQCDFRPGVINALMDPDFGNQPKPFTSLAIPGIIPAVHYDFGTISVGYSDTDFKNVGGPGGAQWNNGWDYRNDGVDIEESQDPQGYPYNVGWIEDNEWLRYTVDISDSGKYNVDLRVASAVGGGECRLYLNNQPLGNIINISNTGGWQNWQTVNGPDLQLPAGTHQIIISFPKGGFNLNQMAFAAESTEINHHNGPYPRDYELKQNYPNPFNAGTKIQYYIPVEDEVRLTVYDTTGREVWVLVNKKQPAGDHSIIFQDSRLSSGVYICFLKTDRYQQSRKMVLMK